MLVSCLKKCRLDAVMKSKKIQCTIPRYRFDIFGGMDIVEEVALGYGIENLNQRGQHLRTLVRKMQHLRNLTPLVD